MQAAEHEAWSKAGQNNLPAFDLNASDASSGAAGRVDWNARFRGGWGMDPSPFGGKADKSTQNFADFLAEANGSNDDQSGDNANGAKFDKMGIALNSGKSANSGKGAGH